MYLYSIEVSCRHGDAHRLWNKVKFVPFHPQRYQTAHSRLTTFSKQCKKDFY